MKAISLKNLIELDEKEKLLVKRIIMVILIHLVLGTLAAKLGAPYPVLVLILLFLSSAFLGLLHWLSLNGDNDKEEKEQKEEQEKESEGSEQLVLTALLTLISGLSMLIPLLLIAPNLACLSLAGLAFGLASLIDVQVITWMNRQIVVPQKVEVLEWVQAFIVKLIRESGSNYVVFKLKTPTPQTLREAVVRTMFDKQPDINLQRLFSNWVWRHNVQATAADQVQTEYTEDQLESKKYEFSFYQAGFMGKKHLDPVSPFTGLKCKWRYTLIRDEHLHRWRIVRAAIIHVQRYKQEQIENT